MATLETRFAWTLSSTGTGKFVPTGLSDAISWGIETSSGCTASVQLLARWGSTSGPNHILSTVQCTVSDGQTTRSNGPLEWVAPRVKDKTAGGTTNVVTVYLKAMAP